MRLMVYSNAKVYGENEYGILGHALVYYHFFEALKGTG